MDKAPKLNRAVAWRRSDGGQHKVQTQINAELPRHVRIMPLVGTVRMVAFMGENRTGDVRVIAAEAAR